MNGETAPDVPPPQSSAAAIPVEEGAIQPAPGGDALFADAIKQIKRGDVADGVDELQRGLKDVAIYIQSVGNMFTGQVHGQDFVGHDQSKHAAGEQGAAASAPMGQMFADTSKLMTATEQIVATDIAKIQHVYVHTEAYESAKLILDQHHLLVLWGGLHLGKGATALHLLSSLHAENVSEVDPLVEDLTALTYKSGQGYIIVNVSPDTAGRLSRAKLRALSDRLKEQRSHLVITADSRWLTQQEALASYSFRWTKLPGVDVLLDKHLAWYLNDNQAALPAARGLATKDAVSELLHNKLPPGEVDRLAEILAASVLEGQETDAALARFSARAQQQVKLWFTAHTDPRRCLLMIALAVLDGSSYRTIIEASRRLEDLVLPPEKEGEGRTPEAIFSNLRSELADDICASIVQGYEETEYGRSPVELLTMDNPAFRPAVLHYAWNELDHLRDPLLRWLHDLAWERSLDVRSKAAAATGELSTRAFSHVREKVLVPWATAREARVRKLVGLALSVPILKGDLAPQTLGLLHYWSTQGNPLLRWTAAFAYGGYAGLRFPDRALNDLAKIARGGDAIMFMAVAASMLSLFKYGRHLPVYYTEVIRGLLNWVGEKKGPQSEALLIFWELMCESRVAADSEAARWPTLLWLSEESVECEEAVTHLLQQTLNKKLTRPLVLEELRNWLAQVKAGSPLFRPLGRIIYTLLKNGDARERERLVSYLTRWAGGEANGSAGRILSLARQHLHL